MSRVVDMTRGNPSKLILKFALPLIVTNLGQQLYMIVDAAIVGRGVGVKALAAVGATDWTYWLVLWTVIGLTQGFSTFVSRYFGEKDFRKMNGAVAMSAILCAVIGSLLTVAGLLVVRPLMTLLKTPADIFNLASNYLTTMVAGMLVVTAYNMAAAVLRAFGDGRSPLIAMIIAALLNIGLDLLFVMVFHWGVFGAALASVLSQLVSFIYCLIRILKIEYIRLDRQAWRIDWGMIRDLLAFAMPLAVQYIIICIGGIILQSTMNLQGSFFIAGYTAANKLYGLLESMAISVGSSFATFFSQNYGAGRLDRIKQGMRAGVKMIVLMAIGVMALVYVLRFWLLQLFLDVAEEGGAEALGFAVYYLTIMICSLIILYLIHVYRNILQATGVSTWSMISGFAEFGVRVVMSKIVIRWIGPDALFYAEPVSWLGALLCVMLPYYFFYRKRLLGNV